MITTIFMIPIVITEYKKSDKSLYSKKVILNQKFIFKLIVASFFHGIW